MLKTCLLVGLTASAVLFGQTALADDKPDSKISNPPNTINLIQQFIEANKSRENKLRSLVSHRNYKVTHGAKVSAERNVQMRYSNTPSKTFSVLSETGSKIILSQVINPLQEAEILTARGELKSESSITPDNYNFEFDSLDIAEGRPCFRLKASPIGKNKQYLFNGKIWIDVEDFAVVKIEGSPAKKPSIFINKISFVRTYQKIEGFWVPKFDKTVTIMGALTGFFTSKTYILTVEHKDFKIN